MVIEWKIERKKGLRRRTNQEWEILEREKKKKKDKIRERANATKKKR